MLFMYMHFMHVLKGDIRKIGFMEAVDGLTAQIKSIERTDTALKLKQIEFEG